MTKIAIIEGLRTEADRNDFLAKVKGNPNYAYRASIFRAAADWIEKHE